MKIEQVRTVFFSPTGTTEAIVKSVADGFGHSKVIHINITDKSRRNAVLQLESNDLLIAGVPVYMGRVPAIAADFLKKIQADNTPAIAVAVYGNRAYENSLLELSDILEEAGCFTLAAASFIGEHSFSGADTPIAEGRPDISDLKTAEGLGRSAAEKLISMESTLVKKVFIPGTRPYGGVTKIWDEDFIDIDESCTACGLCASVCPTDAIAHNNIRSIDPVKCISCCACIKSCPAGARSIKPGKVKDASLRLNSLFSEPKMPELYI